MEMLEPPRLVYRPEIHYLGLRVVTPFRGMLAKRDELLRELIEWPHLKQVADAGPFFLRLIVIDMDGDMEIEVGAITPHAEEGDDRVSAGVLPAGNYATLTYRDHAMRANKALLDWAAAEGVALDRDNDPRGDRFACRYEAYLTDPRTQPRKTKWEVQLN